MYAGKQGKELFDLIHQAQWETWVPIVKNFNLKKINGDITKSPISGMFDLIYFDAFGPDKQPEMWTTDVFAALPVTEKNGILVTYSAKG